MLFAVERFLLFVNLNNLLTYSGIDMHQGDKICLFDTVVDSNDMEENFENI